MLQDAIEMRTIILLLLSCFLCFVMAGCGKETSRQQNTQSQILDTYFEAFNNHDIQSLAATVADDIRLMSITPDTIIVDLAGKDELKKWLAGYFSSLPNVESDYSDGLSMNRLSPLWKRPPGGLRAPASSSLRWRLIKSKKVRFIGCGIIMRSDVLFGYLFFPTKLIYRRP